MDRQSVFTSRLYGTPAENENSNTHVRGLLESFILDFRLDNIFIYRSASWYPDLALPLETDTSFIETNCAKMHCSRNTTATSTLET
jgi:hypothetical protein